MHKYTFDLCTTQPVSFNFHLNFDHTHQLYAVSCSLALSVTHCFSSLRSPRVVLLHTFMQDFDTCCSPSNNNAASQPVCLYMYMYVFLFFFFSFWLMLYNRSSDMPHGAHALRLFVAPIKWPQSGYISPSVHYPRKPLCRVIYEVIPHVIFLLL